MRMNILLLSLLSAAAGVGLPAPAMAGDVAVEFARFEARGPDTWRISVSLRHRDTGWEHFADAWRVVSPDGRELATRTLYHPHETEQPFTRSLGDLRIPAGMERVFVEAHDKVHGWSPDRIEVDLGKHRGERYEIRR